MYPPWRDYTSFGISRAFVLLSPSQRQVAYALLTRLPLGLSKASFQSTPFDLHVLSTPPAFVLSQDQTLHKSVAWHFRTFAIFERALLAPEFVLVVPRFRELRKRIADCLCVHKPIDVFQHLASHTSLYDRSVLFSFQGTSPLSRRAFFQRVSYYSLLHRKPFVKNFFLFFQTFFGGAARAPRSFLALLTGDFAYVTRFSTICQPPFSQICICCTIKAHLSVRFFSCMVAAQRLELRTLRV